MTQTGTQQENMESDDCEMPVWKSFKCNMEHNKETLLKLPWKKVGESHEELE